MIIVTGFVLIALGLVSGGALLGASAGWIALTSTTTLWVLFPLGSAGGLLLAALGSHAHSLPALLKITGSAMLLLSLGAIVVLALSSLGVLPALAHGPAALWYVFVVGLVVGTANFLAPAAPGQPI